VVPTRPIVPAVLKALQEEEQEGQTMRSCFGALQIWWSTPHYCPSGKTCTAWSQHVLAQVSQALAYYQLRLKKLNSRLNTSDYVRGPGASSYRHPSRHKAGCEQRVQVHSELLELFLQPQWRWCARMS